MEQAGWVFLRPCVGYLKRMCIKKDSPKSFFPMWLPCLLLCSPAPLPLPTVNAATAQAAVGKREGGGRDPLSNYWQSFALEGVLFFSPFCS